MKVVLFGATGMIGTGVLLECLADPRVESVLAVGRRSVGRAESKLRELLRTDFLDFDDAADALAGQDACFFCLGVSSLGRDEASYRRVTFDLTVSAAAAFAKLNPDGVFCYISGEGADSTERGRSMWARVKGETENRLLQLGLDSYIFRPGFVQPMKGARSRTPLYRVLYAVASPFFAIVRRLAPRHVTTSENIGRAMIRVAATGSSIRILENPDINLLASAN